MSNQIDRRRFLASGAALAGMASVAGVEAKAESRAARAVVTRVRYSAFDPGANLESYRKGVTQMKQWGEEDATDPRGWEYQAAIHKSRRPDNGIFNQCPHGSWWFFPWHRAYLFYFEQIIREASKDDNFNLPYWDWDAEGRKSLPPQFRNPQSELFDARRSGPLNGGAPLPTAETDADEALGTPEFLGPRRRPGFGGVILPYQQRYQGPIESGVHDNIHGEIGHGGDMSHLETAALDPIFWLHHCNIDRLWDIWLSGGRSNPPDTDWKDNRVNGQRRPWVFFDGKRVKREVVTSDFLPGSPLMDYRYDDLRGHSQSLLADSGLRERLRDDHRVMMMAPNPQFANQVKTMQQNVFGAEDRVLVTSGVNGITLGPAPITVKAEIKEDKRSALMQALPFAAQMKPDSPAILLNVENVRAANSPGISYRVFLNQPDATAETNTSESNYLGSIGLFLGQDGGHEDMPGGARNF